MCAAYLLAIVLASDAVPAESDFVAFQAASDDFCEAMKAKTACMADLELAMEFGDPEAEALALEALDISSHYVDATKKPLLELVPKFTDLKDWELRVPADGGTVRIVPAGFYDNAVAAEDDPISFEFAFIIGLALLAAIIGVWQRNRPAAEKADAF